MEDVRVRLTETLTWLQPRPGGVYVDATLGGGGHAEAILDRIVPGGRLIGIDRDEQALEQASRRLERFGGAVTLIRENFAAIGAVLLSQGIDRVDGVLFDLGASTMQFADPQRGFSFSVAGPLDMRMDRRQRLTAAELVNGLAERDLADLIWRYGEERWSRRIARGIVRARPLATTVELAEVVRRAIPRRGGARGVHPGNRTVQAARNAVHDELSNLDNGIPTAAEVVPAGGPT